MKQLLYSLVVPACLALSAADASAGRVTQVASGATHSCAVTPGGDVLCWGYNFYGQLGDGSWTDRWAPTVVVGLEGDVVAVAAGLSHTCALTAGGGVVCWGRNNNGQVGDDTTTDRRTPVAVSGLESGVAAITAGEYHTCALTTSGAVVCWGLNDSGQLGDGTVSTRRTPTGVTGLESGVAAISTRLRHTCAMTAGGGVLCWGSGSHGQIGDGTTGVNRTTPRQVVGLESGVAAIAAGGYHTCALLEAGGVGCWGYNGDYQLADGTTFARVTPVPATGLGSDVTAIAAGEKHNCALTTSGGAVCWGRNIEGQIGDGTGTTHENPATPMGLESGVAAVAVGYNLSCALTNLGGLSCWGANDYGQLGDGTTTEQWEPVHVVGLEGRATAASDFTGDLKSDVLWRHASLGEVWLWPMDGATRTAEAHVRTVSDTNWEIRGLGDQTGDGKAAILWRNKVTGQIYLWPMYGSTPLDEVYVATVDPSYDIVGTGDFNGDGKSDILWRHEVIGAVWVWLMDGGAAFDEFYMASVNPGYVVKGTGDVDGDGKADIVWHHATTGQVWIWLMNGTTRLSETWVATVPDTGYQIQGVADFTGDGQADVLWWHATRGEVWIWTMNGATREAETPVSIVPDTGYRIVGAGDYDGDGKADMLWHHATTGEVWVWLMDGTTRLSETFVTAVPDVSYQIVKAR